MGNLGGAEQRREREGGKWGRQGRRERGRVEEGEKAEGRDTKEKTHTYPWLTALCI